MNRKTIFIFGFLFFISVKIFSQNYDLKDYSDILHEYSGASVAIYVGNVNDEDTNEKLDKFMGLIPETVKTFTKLTKNNMWLCKKALNEWDYEKDECYFVFCADSKWADEFIFLVVRIKGKDDFDWSGFLLTKKIINEMESKLEDQE